MSDRVRDRWASGETALNVWLGSADPATAAGLASAGFDAAVVDLQHGRASLDTLEAIVAVIEPTGTVPFVRIRWNDPGLVMRALDLGARGLICPMVNSAAEAEAFARACRYPPLGVRSYGPVHGAFGSGREQTERANEAVLAFAQIETAEGLANVAEIAATPGLDGLYVGPADLSLTLGLHTFADLSDRALLEALDRVLEAAARAGAVAGIHAPSTDEAITMAGRGFRFIGAATDADPDAARVPASVRRGSGDH
ncbi:MAG TPA: aldolase/citrate lyase family protein [Actinomycetota bacterium]|nr:aldolase/citrate lyase family protein [Actinomycetota bacterium]